jgi:FkbM family methyltransferase
MLLNRNDVNQTGKLVSTGQGESHFEISLLRQFMDIIKPDYGVFVDVGANVGTHCLAMARHLDGRGEVIAFEPQRLLFHLICGTLALNAVTNAYVYNAAVGAAPGNIELPQFDYFQKMNFGSVELGPTQREQLHQERATHHRRPEIVPVMTIDGLKLEALHILKIDVEGMENSVLDGATETIARCQPLILIEFCKVDAYKLGIRLCAMGYLLFIHDVNFICLPPRFASVKMQGFEAFDPTVSKLFMVVPPVSA